MSHTNSDRVGSTALGRRGLITGGAGLALGSAAMVAGSGPAAASDDWSNTPSARTWLEIYQLKVNYAFATDSLTDPDKKERARALYRAAFAPDAEISVGYDEENPDWLVHGPDELFALLEPALASYLSTQHLIGTVDITLGDRHGRRRTRFATLTAHVQATLVPRESLGLTRLLATYHDQAERRRSGRWQITKSFAQYLATESAERDLPPGA